jgi:hypothetical protein
MDACRFIAHSADCPDAGVLGHANQMCRVLVAYAHVLDEVQRHEDLFVLLAV